MVKDIFERASRQNLCYEGYKGLISVNDLWSLPLKGRGVTLDKIWTDLYTSTKDDNIVSPAMKTNRKGQSGGAPAGAVSTMGATILGWATSVPTARSPSAMKSWWPLM